MTDFGDFKLKDDEIELLQEAIRSKRFLAASRVRVDVDEIATWDDDLVREFRLLVPIDVQALVVGGDDGESMVRLPMLLSESDGVDPDKAMPPLFDEGSKREPGVHLHWAMPDALLRGRLESGADEGSADTSLSLPPLPDRWVVIRTHLPVGGTVAITTGWVVEADTAVVHPLKGWTEKTPRSAGIVGGVELEPEQLTGTAGGSVVWSAVYDAVRNRFALHDPLTDLDPDTVDRSSVSYLVAGWWSDPDHDVLDAARSTDSLDELLDRLGWRLVPEWGDARYVQEFNDSIDKLRAPLGLKSTPRSERGRATSSSFTPIDQNLTTEGKLGVSSPWAHYAGEFFVTEPWHLRTSLLHGAVYGVPIDGKIDVDRRPSADGIRIALGEHDGDVLAALSSLPGTSEAERRDAERLLEAFASQKINRLGTPDGIVEIENDEHAAAFASLPGGTAGTDRFEQRAAPGQAGGTRFGADLKADLTQQRPRVFGGVAEPPLGGIGGGVPGTPAGVTGLAVGGGRQSLNAEVQFALQRHDLVELGVYDLVDLQRRDPITLAPTEPRVVERPAPRYSYPVDPMVAVQGAGRSLRHANDGKASPDGKLTCRWPTQICTETEGVLSGEELIPALGNGSIPPEVLSLAREVAIHDPYHISWRAAAASTMSGLAMQPILRRLVAESAVRFGIDAVYDGTTQAFGRHDVDLGGVRGRAARAGLAESSLNISMTERSQVADRLMKFSLCNGADPDPVAVTAWSQPWVPLWLEWEVAFDPPPSPDLAGWELGSVDLEPGDEHPSGTPRTLRGRVLLTTGAATTLQRAVDDWLAAEDAREAADPVAGGETDDDTEAALAALARAVTSSDIVTASLDGFFRQLLGLGEGDNERRRDADGVLRHPAPVEEPAFLASGRVRLARTRLVDAFGRVLDVPVTDVAVTVRDAIDGDPGALSFPPRLARPARWRLSLVDAATTGDRIGVEARVDQIDRTLQVNPVAGFLLPDHLDESLEFFDSAGNPLGELLHEPVGGGVVWEIAPGRAGPPSSGPSYGLAPAQHTLGLLANGVLAADSDHRRGGPADGESALGAWLRAIDTTLWTVDTYASLGSEHVAGLVGRPIAVVRAQVRLELLPVDKIDLSDPEWAARWAEAEAALSTVSIPLRIGELTRTDDGVLGFFVDDDYSRFRPVDKVVAALAAEGGRNRGHLGLLGQNPVVPSTDPITHPFIGTGAGTLSDSDTFTVHLGQTVTLTLLMHPAGVAHVSSGILPRFSVGLARDWVAPGLATIAPALRTGPVLVDTDLNDAGQVRLPKVSVFGQDQDFWWRDTPGGWRQDAILAATQTALLPDTPAEVREGWIRVRPTIDDPGDGPASSEEARP